MSEVNSQVCRDLRMIREVESTFQHSFWQAVLHRLLRAMISRRSIVHRYYLLCKPVFQ